MMGHSSVRASSYQVTRLGEPVNPDHGTANRVEVSHFDDRRLASQVHGPRIWARVTTTDERVGRSPWAVATNWAMGRPLSRPCRWSGSLKVSWRIWVSALMRVPRAERLATTRTRFNRAWSRMLPATPDS
jgi:hypothetical protein